MNVQEIPIETISKEEYVRPASIRNDASKWSAKAGKEGGPGTKTVGQMMKPYLPAKKGPRRSDTYRSARRLVAKQSRKPENPKDSASL